jgi:hypothetical protein
VDEWDKARATREAVEDMARKQHAAAVERANGIATGQ